MQVRVLFFMRHWFRDLKDALVDWIVSNIDATWALAPTVARLKEHGIASDLK